MQVTAPPASATADAQTDTRARTGRGLLVITTGALVLAVLMIVHIRQGMASISPGTIVDAIFNPDGSPEHQVVLYARLPRVVAGIVAGVALGIAGVLLQAVTRNPLASASTIGVNAGAYLAVIASSIFAPTLLAFSSPLVAFTGGLIAAVVVYSLASGSASSPTRLALAGMAITLGLGSITSTLILFNEYTITGLYFWGSGSLIQRNWTALDNTWYWVALIGVASTLFLARALDVLGLGDDVAASLGQNVRSTRLVATLAGVMAAALSVSIAGSISFVGLVAPHLVRLSGVRRHWLLLPAAALWGAVILVGADVLGRIVAGQYTELPAGVFTALVGAPWMIWLARRVSRNQGRASEAQTEALTPRAKRRSQWLVWPVAMTLFLAITFTGLVLGDRDLSGFDVIRTFLGSAPDALTHDAVLTHRLPRMIVAGLAGAGLAVSGLMVQGVVRNPLAAPDLVGISPGASIGALVVLIAVPSLPIGMLPIAAFAGASISFTLVYALSWSHGISPTRLALVGIGMSAAAGAVANLIIVNNTMQRTTAMTWLSGSTYARGWGDVTHLLPWMLMLLPLAWAMSRWLDLFGLGEDVPRSLGISLDRTRLMILAVAVALAAAAVSIVGAIGFIGLLAPHSSRMMLPGRHRLLIPFTAIIGATLLIGADTIGRTLMAPSEIPSGLIAAAVGTPYFLWLLARSRQIRR
ncbi:MAG: iron ABC transporter permease [Chloroflexota bacterium]|nr:iron ABC transporter permease [Chloroflexota bacterium]